MDQEKTSPKQGASLHQEGGRLAARNAFMGSLAFGLLWWVLLQVNTYLVQKIDAPFEISSIFIELAGMGLVTITALALTYLPARFMGGRLVHALEQEARNQRLSKKSAFLKGAQFGAAAACMICVPLLVVECLFLLFFQHGDLVATLFLSALAILVASIAGGFTGRQMMRLVAK